MYPKVILKVKNLSEIPEYCDYFIFQIKRFLLKLNI